MVKAARYLTVLGIGLSASAIVGWLLLRENRRQRVASVLTVRSQHAESLPEVAPEIVLPREALDEAARSAEMPETQPEPEDDLTRIKDIGPRFASALAAVGITRFEQLAAQTPETLAERLAGVISVRASRIREKRWIEQAQRLAPTTTTQ